MQVQNHVWGPAIMTVITALANVPINIWLIKHYDFWGAAVATSVARVLLLILLIGAHLLFILLTGANLLLLIVLIGAHLLFILRMGANLLQLLLLIGAHLLFVLLMGADLLPDLSCTASHMLAHCTDLGLCCWQATR